MFTSFIYLSFIFVTWLVCSFDRVQRLTSLRAMQKRRAVKIERLNRSFKVGSPEVQVFGSIAPRETLLNDKFFVSRRHVDCLVCVACTEKRGGHISVSIEGGTGWHRVRHVYDVIGVTFWHHQA